MVKTLDVWLAALKTPLKKRGYELTDKQIGANFELFKNRAPELGVRDVDSILAEAQQLAQKLTPEVTLYPGVTEVLSTLHARGIKLALVTTSEHAMVDPILNKYNIAPFFDAIICGDDVSRQKPDAQPVLMALSKLQAKSEESIIVGDSSTDIRAGQAAGIDTAVVYPPDHVSFYNIDALKKYGPTVVLTDIRDATNLV